MMRAMSNALVKRSGGGTGIVPAACSAVLPGLGQLVNGQTDKGVGVLVVGVIAGAGFVGALPLIGWLAGTVYTATCVYGVADAFIQGRKKR
jgi:TM2 domain-containing membrane protein YozV